MLGLRCRVSHLPRQFVPLRLIRSFNHTSYKSMASQTTPTRPKPDYTIPSESDITPVITPSGHWTHNTPSTDQSSLSRSFTFPTFNKAWSFMSKVADQAVFYRHHPEWSNTYNKVFVRWTTHKVGGQVTKVDLTMAQVCDEAATEFGEIVKQDGSERAQDDMAQLADMTQDGCDACATGKVSK